MPTRTPSSFGTPLIVACALALLACSGCAVQDIAGKVGTVKGTAQSIVSDTDLLTGHVDETGKPVVDGIRQKGESIVRAADEVLPTINKQSAKLNKLEGSTFVWLEKVLKGVVYGLLGVLGAWFVVDLAVGIAKNGIGGGILNLLPSNITGLLAKGKKAVQTVETVMGGAGIVNK